LAPLRLQLLEQMREGVDGELHVVGRRRLERVVADAGVFAAHEEHRLRHGVAHLHGVVAGAARHAVHRQAGGLDRALPARLPLGAEGDAATRIVSSRARPTPRRAQIASSSATGRRRQASRTSSVVERMSRVKRQRPGTTLIEPLHLEMPMVPNQLGAAARAFEERPARTDGGGVAAAVPSASCGVAGDAAHLAGWRTLPLIEVTTPSGRSSSSSTGPLLDVDLDEAEVAAGSRRSAAIAACSGRPALHRLAQVDAVGVGAGRARRGRTGRRARRRRGTSALKRCPSSSARRRLDREGQPTAGRCSSRTQIIAPDAEPAVVLAGVAHGVEMRAGEQGLRPGLAPRLDPTHVARPRRCRPLVEAHSAHPRL
jgi:hypothetical protein